jgi:Type VI secretion system (T6SS), amidase effector protein 4
LGLRGIAGGFGTAIDSPVTPNAQYRPQLQGRRVVGSIPVSIETIRRTYPHRIEKAGEFGGKLADPDLQKVMDRNPGTPCCVQVSHALNLAGFPIRPGFNGERRKMESQNINGITYYFLLAVDEMENYLIDRYGSPAEAFSNAPITVTARTAEERKRKIQAEEAKDANQISARIRDRPGLLVMRDSTFAGIHTEFWTGKSFLQTDMAVAHLLSVRRVLFWDCTLAPPQWLRNYMGS